MAFWILKTEPSTYSIDDLKRDKKTNWNNIRNYQARNFLREMKVGDQAFIYHSGDEKAVVGTATIVKESYQDPSDDQKEWLQVDIRFESKFETTAQLSRLKSEPKLKNLTFLRQSRLSVSPINAVEAAFLRTLVK